MSAHIVADPMKTNFISPSDLQFGPIYQEPGVVHVRYPAYGTWKTKVSGDGGDSDVMETK